MIQAHCGCMHTFFLTDDMHVFSERGGTFAVECPKCKRHVYNIPKQWAKKRLAK